MILQGPTPTFIILAYTVGLTGLMLALLPLLSWLKVNVILFMWPFKLTLPRFALLFLFGAYSTNLLALINVMLGADRHILDFTVLSLLFLLNAFPLIILLWLGRRIIRFLIF